MAVFAEIVHEADFCVVGGGMAGICAAIAAARHGARVVLMHERPVLGGNASSECRMHVCGADRHGSRPNLRETGILEELRLENLRRNHDRSYSIWDLVLYEKVRAEPNLTLLLNCTCQDAAMQGGHIESVTGWQLTTQTYHRVHARIFADCSGDSVLAPLTGAEFRVGREARAEYGESIAPETADARTMGMTCLFHAREMDGPRPFEPPASAYRFEKCEDLPYGAGGHGWLSMGYWWVELGGMQDSIHDTEEIRDELLRIVMGVWDHIKNHCASREKAANWSLDWLQFLPGKRESRRYLGAHVLAQRDVEAGGLFEDRVAYGGWSMDDHHPEGFWAVRIAAPATVFHSVTGPYGIPLRSLYSRNVPNLMFAGRNISATHAAMSSTRVMGTACSMGQATGTAAGIAIRHGILPGGLAAHVREVQQALLGDDAYLPGIPRVFGELTSGSALEASQGDPAPVRDGITRPVADAPHCWMHRPGDWIGYRFAKETHVDHVALVLDSALDSLIAMSHHQRDNQLTGTPPVMPRAFRIEGLIAGTWEIVAHVGGNTQRVVRVPVNRHVDAIRYVLEETWGAPETRMFAFEVA